MARKRRATSKRRGGGPVAARPRHPETALDRLKRMMSTTSGVVGGVIVAVVTAVAVAWAVFFAGPSTTGGTTPLATQSATASGAPGNGPPLRVSLFHETSRDDPEVGTTVFPRELNLSQADLQSINSRGITAWLAGRGGYESVTELKLTVTGRRPCRILDMRADVLSRSSPMTGTLFRPYAGGGEGSILFTFNLDSPGPVALVSTNDYTKSNPPAYFQAHTFTLAPGEQHTFQVEALTSKYAVQWVIDIVVLDGNKTIDYVVKDSDGGPFRTSAVAGFTQEKTYYKSIYTVCGMVGPNSGTELNVPQCGGKSGYLWVKAK